MDSDSLQEFERRRFVGQYLLCRFWVKYYQNLLWGISGNSIKKPVYIHRRIGIIEKASEIKSSLELRWIVIVADDRGVIRCVLFGASKMNDEY